MEQSRVIVTGADGGMGRVITERLAQSGYEVIMACLSPSVAQPVCLDIQKKYPQASIEVRGIDLCSLDSVESFCRQLLEEKKHNQIDQ